MAMIHSAAVRVALLLLMIFTPWQQSTSGVDGMNSSYVELDDEAPTNSSSHVVVALSYPNIRIGPYSWRYFRVEVPRAFAELSILLTRKWTAEHIGNQEDAKVPLVCFRFGSPPLPDSVLESPHAAAMAAGKPENLSGTGKCAWFHSNSSIALTNMQTVAGIWYVGVFSDSLPSRFQSKMITRGSIFTFGIHFTVSGCKSPNLRGHGCDVAVKPLCSETPAFSGNSNSGLGRKVHNLEAILTQQGADVHASETALNLIHRPKRIRGEEDAWTSLTSQRVGPEAWEYFALEITEFALSLQVRAVCTSSNCNATLPGNRSNLFLSYGALPDEGDKGTAMGSLAPFTVLTPRRGPWYVGVRNPNTTSALDFDLHWHVESCSHGTAVDRCAAAINSMERVLVEDASESPFNSYYRPAREEGLLHSPWFFLSEATQVGNKTSGNWTVFFVEVPRGAAGAVLSVKLRHVAQATISVYARLEGLATPDNYDVSIMNAEGKDQSNRLSLDLVYPAEGVWCIGVHSINNVGSIYESTLASTSPSSSRFIELWRQTSKSIAHGYRSTVEWLGMSWRSFCSAIDPYRASKAPKTALSPSLSSSPASDQLLIELSRRQDVEAQMHIGVHGCVNKCSGHGRCVTSYESSRLHFYSYCHCDAAHGGIDCSIPLLVPREEALHIWALIGSNFAAFVPSFWAMRHQAYSEWVSYVASGVASGFYHSCDAGGWCALSYDTLQFLDFWLAFLVVIVTCVYIASFKQDMKAVAHIGAAIITAAITKENATSAWNVLLVVLIGLAGLLLGWALECWRLRLIPSWFSAIGPIRPVIRLESMCRYGEQLLNKTRARFRWPYLIAGIGILSAAGLSWVLETAETYWIWHSLWHVSIYTSAFLILCSTSKSTPKEDSDSGYERASQQQASDPEASPMLRHTVELDAFATDRESSLVHAD